MFSVNKVVIEAFIDELVSHYSQMYGHNELDIHLLESHARNTLEIISNSDAPYHDVTHTILVTMVGQEILRGKHLLEGSVSAKTWVNFIISLLHHDIGYVRGVCFEDRGGSYVVNEQMERIMPPPGATDAYLTPYHVDRSKIYMMEHYKDDTSLELINILSCIERTRFPVPPAESHQDIGDYPGLARAADLIGQLADPQYLKKISSLFAEFSETGQSSSMGYENSADMRKGYSKFFWEKVDPYIGEGLRYLRCTQEGQQWVANLYANLFTEENEIPAFGPERRGKPDRRSLQE
ncbi:MAG: metal-dependent phosphohydrolase, partial [Gammaproteobacteria bacterium]|nr:metal-dependent phosphohydrolase [Gammaproteobacteria bacterium]